MVGVRATIVRVVMVVLPVVMVVGECCRFMRALFARVYMILCCALEDCHEPVAFRCEIVVRPGRSGGPTHA